MTTTLPAILQEPIQALLDEGDKLFDKGKFDAALAKYTAARDLLPSERERWEASTWVLTAIGDTHFLQGNFVAAQDALQQASVCPEGAENPFILLRLGQCAFELANVDHARTLLQQAYQLAGEDVFEDEDEKYQQLIAR